MIKNSIVAPVRLLPSAVFLLAVLAFVFGCSKNGGHRHDRSHASQSNLSSEHDPSGRSDNHTGGDSMTPEASASTTGAESEQAEQPNLSQPNLSQPAIEPAPAERDLLALEFEALRLAQPILEAKCAGCHTTARAVSKKAKKALKHFVMDSYPYGGHHVSKLGASIRKVLGVDGGHATMPKDDPGSIQGTELEQIVSWTRAWDHADQAGLGYHARSGEHAHPHGHQHQHGHTQ